MGRLLTFFAVAAMALFVAVPLGMPDATAAAVVPAARQAVADGAPAGAAAAAVAADVAPTVAPLPVTPAAAAAAVSGVDAAVAAEALAEPIAAAADEVGVATVSDDGLLFATEETAEPTEETAEPTEAETAEPTADETAEPTAAEAVEAVLLPNDDVALDADALLSSAGEVPPAAATGGEQGATPPIAGELAAVPLAAWPPAASVGVPTGGTALSPSGQAAYEQFEAWLATATTPVVPGVAPTPQGRAAAPVSRARQGSPGGR